jgi:hypothetical protein
MKKSGIETLARFQNEGRPAEKPGGKTHFFLTLNKPASFASDRAALALAAYSADGRLFGVALKRYENIRAQKFLVMRAFLELPETPGLVMKAFVWDGALRPLLAPYVLA